MGRILDAMVVYLRRAAGLLLVAMMALSCMDVLGNVVGRPILGSIELVGLMAALLLAFALPSAHAQKAHIGIDLIRSQMSPRIRRINDMAVNAITAVFFGLVSWQCILYAQELRKTGEVSTTLQLPLDCILLAMALSCLILSLTMLRDVFTSGR
ncbi:MAG: TRAP transporter small permease [Desulfovermiculus sp.]